MEEGLTHWATKDNRRGLFDNYTVMGFKYQNASGEIGWHITSWLSGFDPVHDYWVSGRNFHSVRMDFFYNGTPYNRIEIFTPPITSGIEQEERKAVLKAITEWEKADAAP